jgi:hypothetical protein
MNIKDDASLALIPVAYKTSKLYSVIPNTDDGDFDFSRGSNGTRVNKGGLIETMPINTPRLDYPLLDGVVQGCPTLLLEPSRTNLIPYSEDFSNSGWTLDNTTVVANSAVSPDGSLNADKIIATAINSSHSAFISLSSSTSSGTSYCYSFFAKAEEYTKTAIRIGGGGYSSQPMAVINLLNGSVVSQQGFISLSVKDFSNGWYKINAVFTATSSVAPNIQPIADGFTTTSDNYTYNGDGTSGIYIWGAQFEAGSYPTSYIRTNGEVGGVTRSADDCVDAGTAADFNDSEGVLYVNAKIDDPSEADDNDFSLGDGSFVSNSVEISFKNISASSQSIVGKCAIDGSSLSITPTTITDASIKHDLFHKVAYQYKQADFKMFVNGFKIGTSTYNDIFPSGGLVRVSFEGNGTAGTKFRGNTKEVMTFNEALSDTELEALTSYDSFKEMATEQLYTIE